MRQTALVTIILAFTLSVHAQHTKPSPHAGGLKSSDSTVPHSTATGMSVARGSVTPEGAGTMGVNTLPIGTAIKMRLETALATETGRGGSFSGRVTEAVVANGRTLIPSGASIQGTVVKAGSPRRFRGLPSIELRPEFVTLPSGRRLVLNAVSVDTDDEDLNVSDEGAILGRGRTRRDNLEAVVATGAGATIGGFAGGGKGLLMGGAIGGTASVVRWLAKRNQAKIAEGTEIIFELDRPLVVDSSTLAKQ